MSRVFSLPNLIWNNSRPGCNPALAALLPGRGRKHGSFYIIRGNRACFGPGITRRLSIVGGADAILQATTGISEIAAVTFLLQLLNYHAMLCTVETLDAVPRRGKEQPGVVILLLEYVQGVRVFYRAIGTPAHLGALESKSTRNLDVQSLTRHSWVGAEISKMLPDCVAAYAGLSMSYGYECDQLLAEDYSESLKRHLEFAEKAIGLDESDSRGHYAMVCALSLSGQFELADLHAVRALELNPNEYHNLCNRGYTLMSLGRVGESVACFSESLRRNPLAPNSCLFALGLIEYLEKNYALSAFAMSRLPASYLPRGSSLAAAYGQLGYEEEASYTAREFQRIVEGRPGCPSVNDDEGKKKFWGMVYPYLKQESLEHMIEGISKAGLPV